MGQSLLKGFLKMGSTGSKYFTSTVCALAYISVAWNPKHVMDVWWESNGLSQQERESWLILDRMPILYWMTLQGRRYLVSSCFRLPSWLWRGVEGKGSKRERKQGKVDCYRDIQAIKGHSIWKVRIQEVKETWQATSLSLHSILDQLYLCLTPCHVYTNLLCNSIVCHYVIQSFSI